MTRKLLFSAAGLFAFRVLLAQSTFPVDGVADKNHNYKAFTNVRIQVDPETVIDKGTLLVKDGLIVDAGTAVTIPADAVVYDLTGKTIYPGLIDAYTSYGMPEIKRGPGERGPQYETKTRGAYSWNQALKPETEAYRLFAVNDKSADELRNAGFTSVMTFQRDGIARGSAAVVALNAAPEQTVILKDRAAACYSFDRGSSTQEYPSSLMGAIALLRQSYLDAAWYKTTTDKKEYNISIEAWNNNAALPQIFETSNKLNVLRADKIGDEFRVQYIFKGSGTEYQRIDEIKATNGKFILPLNFPMAYDVEDPFEANLVSYADLKHWEFAPLNPAALEQNGITFALTTSDLRDKKEFWKNLRKAVQYGLTEKTALKALTVVPAQMLGISDKAGALKKGMIASFIITSGNLFNDKTVIFETWVQGKQYVVNEMNPLDFRGTYDMKAGDKAYTLKIAGEAEKPKGNMMKGDSAKEAVSISRIGNSITLSFTPKGDDGVIRLNGSFDPAAKKITGRGQLADGTWIDFNASQTVAFVAEVTKPDTARPEIPSLKDVPYPFNAYGKPKEDPNLIDKLKNRYDAVLIKDVTVWTNEADGVLADKDVYITEGRIVSIGDNITPTKNAFAKVIDGKGKHLTAGIIDEHSHIAVNGDVNEGSQASSAEVRIGDVVNCDDINIYRQLAGGVTAAQLLHGSANPIGGQSALIKLRWGKAPEEMKIAGADGFIKFALGENVKQANWGDDYNIRFPQSRMGVEQVYYDQFTRAREYDELMKNWKTLNAKVKQPLPMPRRDLDLEALAEILNNKRFITCHSYVQSEVNMLMHVADSMNFRVNTFTHILEGYKVADKMKAHGVAASSFSDWWAYKMEVMEATPYNGAVLHKAGIVTGFNSDDAEMARRLNQEAAKAVKYGNVPEPEALKFVTLNPAIMLHLDKRMGSIKVGKEGDVVLWSDNPLSIYAKVEKTLVDGIVYYDAEDDAKMREEIRKERARLIQKMIAEKNGGAPTQRPRVKQPREQHCDTMSDDYMMED